MNGVLELHHVLGTPFERWGQSLGGGGRVTPYIFYGTDVSLEQTWGQLLWNVIHYITITFKVIALYYNYNYSVFEKVMNYITITSPK